MIRPDDSHVSISRAAARTEDRRGRLPLAIGLLLFVPVALAGNEVGRLLRYPDIGAAILYPPYAALTAVLVVSRSRNWVWYILAAAAAHFVTSWPQWSLSWVLMADVANTARALTSAVLLRRFFGGPPRLDGIRALWLFSVGAVFLGPAVGATIGAASIVAHGGADSYFSPWIAWFVSNALTGLVMLPASIVACESVVWWRYIRIDRRRAVEAALLTVALCATCAVAFLARDTGQHLSLPLYAPLPVLIWAALRFGSGGASLALTAVTFTAIWSVDRGAGPFLASSPRENIFALQIFVVCVAGSMLCLASVAAERQRVARLYRALLASLHDQVAILDANGVVLEANDSWRRFAESSVAPLHRIRAGDSYVALCRSAAEDGDVTAAALIGGLTRVLKGDLRRFETAYDHHDGGRRESFTMTVEFLERPDGGAVVFRSNITARRQAQMEIEEQQRELFHLARVAVLGQLSGAFAHELNQPLAAILSNAEAGRRLLSERHLDVGELALIFEEIADDNRRAVEVIQRLRALLRRGERRAQSIDVKEFLNEVLQLAHSELIARHITTRVVVHPDAPPFPADRVQVQQVLLNLILNACEAMSTTTVSRKLTLTAEPDGKGYLHMSVADSGPGIPPELADRLFEPFVSSKPDGLGLGLSISRTIVAAHGGRLWAGNNDGGGATLHCLFPVTTGSDAGRLEAALAAVQEP